MDERGRLAGGTGRASGWLAGRTVQASVLVLAVAACVADEPATGGAVTAIAGGADDTVDVAVVGIVDDGGGATCTGTLIAPDLVLTAQHCVAPVLDLGPCTQGSFGPPAAPTRFHVTHRAMLSFDPGDYRGVTEVRLPPGNGFCGRDLALLRLASLVPAGEALPLAPRLDPVPAAAEPYSAVGYGATDDNGTGTGQRRRRDGLAVACVGDGCASTALNSAEWRGQAGVCGGDSGGPALAADGRVLGVASRGAVGCVAPVYTSVAAHADWLVAEASRAATLRGYPRPAWAGGSPPIDAGPDAAPPALDAGPDAAIGPDAGPTATDGGGGCSTGAAASPSRAPWWPLLALLALVAVRARRSRRLRERLIYDSLRSIVTHIQVVIAARPSPRND